jgi:hypothetical protein
LQQQWLLLYLILKNIILNYYVLYNFIIFTF